MSRSGGDKLKRECLHIFHLLIHIHKTVKYEKWKMNPTAKAKVFGHLKRSGCHCIRYKILNKVASANKSG